MLDVQLFRESTTRDPLRAPEDVAARARAAGLNWKWDQVLNIEKGHRFLSVEELFVLPAIFGITLPELFDDTDTTPLELGDDCAASPAQRRQCLSGSWTPRVRDKREDSGYGLAELKAARKYDVEVEWIVEIAKRLWGRSLSDEREQRVQEDLELQTEWNAAVDKGMLKRRPTARSLQAIRGHVTRELLSELEPEIEARKRRMRALHKEKKR